MFRIAYRSRLTKGTNETDIAAIIKHAVERNGALGITGAWMICDGECLSSIEGPPLAVKAVAESIWDDPRHTAFRLVGMEHTDERLFEGWPLNLLDPGALKDNPKLQDHAGVLWLSAFEGGIDGFFGDALRYHH